MAAIGIAWYDSPEAFAGMAELCPDLRDSRYEDWLEEAERAWAVDAERLGLVRIPLDATSFAAWCKERRTLPIKPARQRYVHEAAKAADKAARAAAKAGRKRRFFRG